MNELKIRDEENLIKEIIMIYKYIENIHRGIDIVPRAKSLIDYEDIDGDRLDFLRYHQINGNRYDEIKKLLRFFEEVYNIEFKIEGKHITVMEQ